MLQVSTRNKKRGNTFHNRRVIVQNKAFTPKVTIGFTVPPSPKPTTTKVKQARIPLKNEKEFPSLVSKHFPPLPSSPVVQPPPSPLILSPIDQVLGCWAYDSTIPPPELLIEKVKQTSTTCEPTVQFDPEHDRCEISLLQLMKVTKQVHQTQSNILYNLVQLKKQNKDVSKTFLLESLIDFVNESKLLVTLCKHVY